MTTPLHAERLRVVRETVMRLQARTVLDLGCGDGDLIIELARLPGVERIEGVDVSRDALERLQARRAEAEVGAAPRGATVVLHHGQISALGPAFAGFDVATLVEVIEHVDPERLSTLERAVFRAARPRFVVMTTPNADFNDALGVPRGRFRHPGHRFEWGRQRFRSWCEGVASRTAYAVNCTDLGVRRAPMGAESQMALFSREAQVDGARPSLSRPPRWAL
ncbi:methyltransferase domain-containing protein [Rubrimonas cliftonensis]|uniref:Small RNA 2'-O-methyltransferase n=1 Tax=Rubrimonas cliftonensis TaxID=89524 RepID=A0A1H4EEQ1_9RHOB|nr:methyltransferase domain-containing protein [Rubrimonas cliftonensis]SEA83198.1 Methyltransferase domain-containing protein [Rubrimonas cliftonensis]